MMFYPIDLWWEEAYDKNYIRFGDLTDTDVQHAMVYRWVNDDFNAPYNPNYYHIVLLF
jgi:hypothetical protein